MFCLPHLSGIQNDQHTENIRKSLQATQALMIIRCQYPARWRLRQHIRAHSITDRSSSSNPAKRCRNISGCWERKRYLPVARDERHPKEVKAIQSYTIYPLVTSGFRGYFLNEPLRTIEINWINIGVSIVFQRHVATNQPATSRFQLLIQCVLQRFACTIENV